MNKEETLKRIIEKAVKNGFITDIDDSSLCFYTIYIASKEYYNLIFSHDFAKAFWKSEDKRIKVGVQYNSTMGLLKSRGMLEGSSNLEEWQYYLQQMVLEEDPIKYLSKFLNE